MIAYMIGNNYGELLLWTASHSGRGAQLKLMDLKKQDWRELEEEGYSVCKVQIKVIVE